MKVQLLKIGTAIAIVIFLVPYIMLRLDGDKVVSVRDSSWVGIVSLFLLSTIAAVGGIFWMLFETREQRGDPDRFSKYKSRKVNVQRELDVERLASMLESEGLKVLKRGISESGFSISGLGSKAFHEKYVHEKYLSPFRFSISQDSSSQKTVLVELTRFVLIGSFDGGNASFRSINAIEKIVKQIGV